MNLIGMVLGVDINMANEDDFKMDTDTKSTTIKKETESSASAKSTTTTTNKPIQLNPVRRTFLR